MYTVSSEIIPHEESLWRNHMIFLKFPMLHRCAWPLGCRCWGNMEGNAACGCASPWQWDQSVVISWVVWHDMTWLYYSNWYARTAVYANHVVNVTSLRHFITKHETPQIIIGSSKSRDAIFAMHMFDWENFYHAICLHTSHSNFQTDTGRPVHLVNGDAGDPPLKWLETKDGSFDVAVGSHKTYSASFSSISSPSLKRMGTGFWQLAGYTLWILCRSFAAPSNDKDC